MKTLKFFGKSFVIELIRMATWRSPENEAEQSRRNTILRSEPLK
jgi:hypothetical protein